MIAGPTAGAGAGPFVEALNALVAEAQPSERGVAYGAHARQRADLYRADPATERRPIVLFYYGGGWTSGDRSAYRFVGAALARRGLTTVIPDYRLFPDVGFPTFVDDAALAYRWTAERFLDPCGRPRPVVVMGHSAGAYLAAMIALDPTHSADNAKPTAPPAGLIGLAGPYSFDPTTWPSTKAIFASAAADPARARPVSFARAAAPPALLMTGGSDETVKAYNTRDLKAALEAKGNAVDAVDYRGIGHVGLVTAIARPLRWRAPVLDDTIDFIARRIETRSAEVACAPARRSELSSNR
jgi:acetyl esterase/lipase